MKNKITRCISLGIKTKKIAIIVWEGVEILDVTGPYSVFAKANIFHPDSYEVCILACSGGVIKTNSGLTISVDGSWESTLPDGIDTLIIAGGHEQVCMDYFKNSSLSTWISEVSHKIRRVVSVCTGVFALGYAGLLQDRNVTTHWSVCDILQNEFPGSFVQKDKVYVRDGNIWSSAGILTGIDLSLALVEDDFGRETAINIGKLLVTAGIRTGESPQQSALIRNQVQASSSVREIISWLQFNFTANCSIDALAARIGLSPRHFSRLFTRETGLSPSKYVMTVRLEYAASLLKTTRWSVHYIAERSGFLSMDALRRGFLIHWGVTPMKYRELSKNNLIK